MSRVSTPPGGAAGAPAGTGAIGVAHAGLPHPPRIGPVELAEDLGLPVPTAEQQAVIVAPLAPAVVVAGAGSGKTETMSARVVWLVANGYVTPDQVLGLTFTTKAAAELGERVRIRLAQLRARLAPDTDPGEPTVLTYHAYAARLVAEHALRIAVEPSARLLTQAMTWQFAERVVRSYDGDLPDVDHAEATVVNWVLDLAAQLAEHLVTAEELREWTDRFTQQVEGLPRNGRTPGKPYAEVRKILRAALARRELLPLVERYEQAKRAAGAMDFGDQMSLAARIAARFPEVGRGERSRYAVVLLDEYQDTSHAQLVLLRALFGGGHPVTAVGDPCQSIYGWRGASAGNLTRFPEHFRVGRTRPAVLPLSTSFRNDRRVLDVANRVSEPLRAQDLDVGVLAPGPANREGMVRCALTPTVHDEAEWVAAEIDAVWSADAPLRERGERGRSVAVLARRRSQFERIEGALRARGIPVELVGLGGLLATPEVRDVVSTLRVLSDPDAGDALVRLLAGPRWRIGPRDLAALGRRARVLARQRQAGTPTSPRPGGPPTSDPSAATAGAEPQADGLWTRQQGVDNPGAACGTHAVEAARVASPVRRGQDGDGQGGTRGGEEPDPDGQGSDAPGRGTEVVGDDVVEDEGSIIEALDDLGPPEEYSPEGYRRLDALRRELAALRRRTYQPLPDLVADVERTLRLDVEVAATPGSAGRVHLDRFLDVAAQFAAESEIGTLGAFLAYLTAAEVQERGLDAGRVEVDDERVQILTVHAAKGLEWDVVAVPGLTASVFPDRDAARGSGWVTNPGSLPYALRGDAEDLPDFEPVAASDQEGLDELRKKFVERCQERGELEERRLAYVALTRARERLLCSGYWWDEATRPRGPSPFLEEVREICASGAGQVCAWAPPPAADEPNPLLADTREVAWPVDPLVGRRVDVEGGADLVRAALSAVGQRCPAGQPCRADRGCAADHPRAADGPTAARQRVAPDEPSAVEHLSGDQPGRTGQAEIIDPDTTGWSEEVDILLAERDRRSTGGPVEVELPTHLSVSSLVVLRRDPAELARQVRRPMPIRPAPLTRRGTAFHAWLEDRYSAGRLLDLDELPGAADDGAAPDEDLAVLQERFLDSPWADRRPYQVEVPFEAYLGGVLVRGRMDAVFQDDDGGFDVIDWKTGAMPSGEAMRAAAVQLAAYRLAWAALAGVPVERVRAGFHYVRANQTVRPVDLLDAEGVAALVNSVDSPD